MTQTKCSCGSADCWPNDDYTWLDDAAGWRGQVNGCEAVVYFVHGKQIAEERHLPEVDCAIEEFVGKLAHWTEGLFAPVLCWSRDTGGGDAGLWLRDVREPTPEDWRRLEVVRERKAQQERCEFARLQRKYEEPPSTNAVDPIDGSDHGLTTREKGSDV